MADSKGAAHRLSELRAQIERISDSCGRSSSDVELLPVTKTRVEAEIRELYHLGLTSFGENRVAEANAKMEFFPDARWHMIGHLQSNKAGDCLGFTWLQSLDKPSTAKALESVFAKANQTLKVLVEVNTSHEVQKDGLRSDEELAVLAETLANCPHLDWQGLMTMAPYVDDEVRIRGCFQSLYNAAVRWRTRSGRPLPVLSMGMSNDFEWAIREGSTLLRIGTRLFPKGGA